MCNHFIKAIGCLGIASLFLSGCVPSLNPLGAKNETLLPGLEGEWRNGETIYRVALNPDQASYSVTERETPDGKPEVLREYNVVLSSLDGRDYASVMQNYGQTPGANHAFESTLNEFFLIPVYQIYELKLNGDELKLFCMGPGDAVDAKFDGLVLRQYNVEKDNPQPIWVLSTEAMRKLVAKFHNSLFTDREVMTMTRVTP